MARYTIDFYSKHLARRIEISAIIPSLNLHESLSNNDKDYYQNRDAKFPLIVFLHGFGDNSKTWSANTTVEALCEKYKVAAVFLNGDNKWYLNLGPIDDYYNLIEEDILDYMYGNFKNLSKEKGLAIAGVSMGGYGALYHYLTNMDKYDECIALSPATKPDFLDETKFGTLKEHFLKNKDKEFNVYLSIGENDFIIGPSKEFNNFFKENKIDVRYKFVPGKDHSWDLWKDEIVNVFDYLNKKGFIG